MIILILADLIEHPMRVRPVRRTGQRALLGGRPGGCKRRTTTSGAGQRMAGSGRIRRARSRGQAPGRGLHPVGASATLKRPSSVGVLLITLAGSSTAH
jgi:hypothetical protein